jgi:S1-C subfamily serine protease
VAPPTASAPAEAPPPRPASLARRERWLWALALLAATVAAGWPAWTARVQRPPSMAQIDAAMRESILKQPLASAGVGAYAAVLPSVVRVVGDPAEARAASARARKPPGAASAADEGEALDGRSVGTGVVVVDKGLILTNLHVVAGAGRISVTFADGTQSDAIVVNRMPDNDLAVLQAMTIPDDLHAATLASTANLAPGDAVMAVGFPFGIGPSASQGVVSGLKREFRSPEGKRTLSNLIQFDAAANPGNSGGPLVTMDGHVVGIVTAIMNPGQQGTFIGIGFAVPIENAAAAAGMPPF